VRDAASAHGIDVTHSEIIGLLPQRTIERGFADRIMLRDARNTVSIEQPVAATLPPDDLSSTAHAIASLDLPQASGTAAALTAILASATVRIAAAWEAVVRARRAPAGNPELLADRIRAVDGALIGGE
jgi:hypothetical protein